MASSPSGSPSASPLIPNSCGKRPRTPETRFRVNSSSDDNNSVDVEVAGEPSAKIPRKRPASPLSASARSSVSASRRVKDQACQSFEQQLPVAPRLIDFMAPGGTKRFRPRPEWCSGFVVEEQRARHQQVRSSLQLHQQRQQQQQQQQQQQHRQEEDQQHQQHLQQRQRHQPQNNREQPRSPRSGAPPLVSSSNNLRPLSITVTNDVAQDSRRALGGQQQQQSRQQQQPHQQHHQGDTTETLSENVGGESLLVAPENGLLPEGTFHDYLPANSDNILQRHESENENDSENGDNENDDNEHDDNENGDNEHDDNEHDNIENDENIENDNNENDNEEGNDNENDDNENDGQESIQPLIAGSAIASNDNRNLAGAARPALIASSSAAKTSSLESKLLSLLDTVTSGNFAGGMAGNTPPSTFGRDFDPALHVSIRENATEAALALIECGAQVEAENAKGVTPVILASQKGNLVVVRELLRRGASPSTTSVNGTTAVMQAAHFGHCEVLELLLQTGGASLMEVANYNHTTPLMRAAQEGHETIVKTLLDRGAAVNRRNRVQMTALMLASQRGHANICKLLVKYGADLDSMTAQHSTSLLLACKRANLEVVRVLVTAGCELWVKDARGRTAREVAQRRNLKGLVDMLDSSVQINLMQRQGRQQRSYDIIRLWNLLQRERATILIDDDTNRDRSCHRRRQVTIHQITQELERMPNSTIVIPCHLAQKSTQALIRTMALPAPLVELIAAYLPLPLLWEKRIGMLMKRSLINADSAVTCALDMIDEILEEGGFVEACDYVRVTPPTHFSSWREWKAYGRLQLHGGAPAPSIRSSMTDAITGNNSSSSSVSSNQTAPAVWMAIYAQSPSPQIIANRFAKSVEYRRQVGFLQILANRSPLLARLLAAPPYNMPVSLIKQLITSSDIQSIVRRMGTRGVHFEPPVAMDLIMLSSRLCSWYNREHDDA